MRVAVCVATYRRPVGLARLLEGIGRLAFAKGPEPEVTVVVVDNDPENSARETCAAAAPALRWPVRCEHEPRRGISHARNRAVAAARALEAEWIAFIDDDEVPEPGWLDELLAVQAAHGADVVLGPVQGRFEDAVPAWVERGRFFDAPRHQTGAEVEHAGAGNALIRVAALDGLDPPFDPRFSLTGGEDTHLFLRLGHAGRRLVWADDALAYEWNPPTRASAGWILRRVYRSASTWSVCERELRRSPKVLGMRVVKGLARIGMGLAMLPASVVLGRHVMMRSLWYVCFGAGNLAGLAGHHLQEYRTTDGA